LKNVKSTRHIHKVEKLLGMREAFVMISEYSMVGSDLLGTRGKSRKSAEGKRKERGRKGVRKIAELWDLSESAEKMLIRKWVETEARPASGAGPFAGTELEGLFHPISKYVPKDESEDSEIEILLGEEENIGVLEKLQEKLRKSKTIVADLGRVKRGHIYLDVTEVDYKTFCRAYKAIQLCRRQLGVTKRDMKRGAPESIDEKRAVFAAVGERSGMRRKEIAESLGFKIYDDDNPSGSFPLLHKYIKIGSEIADKLEKLEGYLQEITGLKVETKVLLQV